jgi:subtilisin family serine protease
MKRACLTLILPAGLFAAVLALGAAGVSSATNVSGQPSARKSPQLTLSLPTIATTGARVLATGKAIRAPRGASVVLQRQARTEWIQLGRAAVSHGKFKVSFKAPSGPAGLRIRAILVKGHRQLARSVVREVQVRAAGHGVKAAGPTTSAPPSLPKPPTLSSGQPTEPAPAPIVVTAAAVTVAVGSVVDANVPSPVTSVTSIETYSSSSVPGVSAVLDNGVVGVAASIAATPGQTTVTVQTMGCAESGCGQHIVIEIPITVRGLQAPEGKLESLTEASPERVAQAEGDYLVDELVITVGSTEDPGTREQAEAAARAVEGVVAGGIEGSGIYQIRWTTRQNLALRQAELEALGSVTSVSYSSVNSYETTEAYPVAQQFENALFTWPYKQVHAREAWSQATGSNVTVGIIDEADVYRGHEDLNVVETLGPYVPPLSSGLGDPEHASHVAGLACARNNTAENGGPQLGMVGIAWGCPIVSVSTVFNASDSMLNLMAAMARRPSVRVVNISLGRGVHAQREPDGTINRCATQAEMERVERAIAKEASQYLAFLAGREGRKIVWVTSAGNDCMPLAANAWGSAGGVLRNVISVAATNSNETLAGFSDYGPGVKVAAPGGFAVSSSGEIAETNGLMSSVPGVLNCPYAGYCPAFICLQAECSEYEEMAGTSMASPIVAGTAALVASKNPGFSAEQIGTCVTGSAGAAGTPGISDYTLGRSDVFPTGVLPAHYAFVPLLPEGGSTPIVDAAAAVECKHRHTAASFRGSGGGDGWAVALNGLAVYNVFHHDSRLQVACHFQATAEPCWTPETITDGDGDEFASSGQPGLWLDQSTGKLYVYATRTSDDTAGVVCIDASEGLKKPDPFCGFTALTGSGEAPLTGGISAISDPTLVGSRWYAFNYAEGAGVTGDENKLLCFNLNTFSACPGQPFSVTGGAGSDEDGDYPPPAVVAIGTQVLIPLRFNGIDQLACFEGDEEAGCHGSWPVDLSENYDSEFGAAFPLMDNAGFLQGFCLPTGVDPCYSFQGTPVATPAGMIEAIPANLGWNGPALTIGARVYVPNGAYDSVDCYDYSTSAACASYPLLLTGLGLLYTVNRDPERPDCIWVNSDNGEAQIQNFEASTGAGTCE